MPTAQAINADIFRVGVDTPAGTAERQAGSHPDVTVSFRVERTNPANENSGRIDQPRRTWVELPPGIVGNATTMPACPEGNLKLASNGLAAACPPETQVGVARVPTGIIALPTGLYNIETDGNQPAVFAFTFIGVTVKLIPEVRGGDYGITMDSGLISQGAHIAGADITMWGVPQDPSHTPLRFRTGTLAGGEPNDNPRQPFLSAPTRCEEDADEFRFRVIGWNTPEPAFLSASSDVNDVPFKYEGCEDIPFDPSMEAAPTVNAADSPTGLEVNLEVPQNLNPDGLTASHVKDVKMTFPEGMSISPSSAAGLGACSAEDIDVDSNIEPDCPRSSKLGTVQIETPLLEEPMTGDVILAKPHDNPFDSLISIYLVAKGPGTLLKLPGEVALDPDSGRITATFENNPQLPFDSLNVRFDGGANASLATPQTCGTHEITSEITPWSGTDPVVQTSSFVIDQGPNGKPCAANLADRPFNPNMKSGVESPVAGASSPFVFQLMREDGDQEILSTTVTPPQGVTAKLAGIPYCSEQDIAANSCKDASRIGTELAGAGAGSSPFYTTKNPGSVYLAGPYKGAPLSMVIQEPVIAGPFDLADMTIRAAIHVDPRTAQLTVISDPIPQINSGIPLRVRDLRIKMDRPDFTIAPSNCDPMQVGAQVQGSHGATATLANRFQVGDCASLGFNPKLRLDLGKSKKNTKRNAHPELNAKLSFNDGDANISSVEVALPQGIFLDQARLGRICSRANYAAETCPEESIVGYAKATTPLLDAPVEGPVYLKASDNPLPDLAADLNGQIDIDLFGKIDQKENKRGVNQIRNTFDIVPDVPVSDFQLTLNGGSDGLLVNSQNICKTRKSQRVSIDMAAHNEMSTSEKPLIGSACKQINSKKASKLKKKAKRLQRKAKQTDNRRKAKQLRKQAKKLKRQARKLGR